MMALTGHWLFIYHNCVFLFMYQDIFFNFYYISEDKNKVRLYFYIHWHLIFLASVFCLCVYKVLLHNTSLINSPLSVPTDHLETLPFTISDLSPEKGKVPKCL
jgi:hypothetical protein